MYTHIHSKRVCPPRRILITLIFIQSKFHSKFLFVIYTITKEFKGIKWMSVNDLKVETCHWPQNVKGAYIFLLEK